MTGVARSAIVPLALSLACSGVSAHLKRGDALRANSKYDEAAHEYLTAVEAAPDDPRPLLALAALYLETKRFDEADRSLKSALALGESRLALELLSTLRAIQRRYDEAQAALDKLCAMVPDVAEYPYRKATLYVQQGAVEPALKSFKQAQKLAPDDPRIATAFGLALHSAKRFDEATEVLKLGLRRTEDPQARATLNVALGGVYEATHQSDYARFSYDKALKLVPQWTPALVGMARVLRSTDKADDAIGLLKPIVEKRPKEAALWRELGLAYADFHLPREALGAVKRAIELEPTAPEHQQALVSVLPTADDDNEAQLEMLSRAAAMLTKDYDVQMRVGRAAFKKRHWPLAVRSFQNATTARGNDAIAYQSLGLAQLANGDIEGAVSACAYLSDIDPGAGAELRRRIDATPPPGQHEPPAPAPRRGGRH